MPLPALQPNPTLATPAAESVQLVRVLAEGGKDQRQAFGAALRQHTMTAGLLTVFIK